MSQSKRQLKLEFPASMSAVYSNGALVSQTTNEIVLDFIQVLPNDARARVQSRVVMTPASAKAFLQALNQNLERFEEKYGPIQLSPSPGTLADELFGSIKPEDGDNE